MKLRGKTLCLVAAVTAVCGLTTAELSRRGVRLVLEGRIGDAAEAFAVEAAPALAEGLAKYKEAYLLPPLLALRTRADALQASACLPDGRVAAHTDVIEAGAAPDDFSAYAINAGVPVRRLLEVQGRPTLEVAAPVWDLPADSTERFILSGKGKRARRLLGIVRLTTSLDEARETERRIFLIILAAVSLAGLLAAGVAMVAAAGILARLDRLVAAVGRVARGDYGGGLCGEEQDELGELSRRFNDMSGTLARTTISKDYLTNIVASTQDALFVTDADGRIALINPAGQKILGLPEGGVLGRPLTDFLSDDGGAASSTMLDLSLRCSDGRKIPVLVSTSAMRDADGMVSGVVCVAKDIADRKAAEAELAYQAALLSAQFEASLDAVLVVDEQERIVKFNARFLELWGLSREGIEHRADGDVLKMVLAQLVDPDAFIARIDELYSRRDAVSHDELALKDGRTFDRYSAPVRSTERYFGRVWYFRDVTMRKQAQEATVLRERDRLQREFVANVSHELRTPITAIKGFAETLLIGALNDKENRRGFVETIERNADRLAKLVDNLLNLSLLESGKRRPLLEPVELGPFVKDFAASLEPLARRAKLSLDVSVPPLLRAKADPGQLSQVLQNLLDNAIKFSRPGGRVVVEGKRDGDTAVLSISDAGIGIPAKDLPLVFDRFHRAGGQAREIKGTGLGLAIAKQIVELHGGKIWAESSEGKGATFLFTLPAADTLK